MRRRRTPLPCPAPYGVCANPPDRGVCIPLFPTPVGIGSGTRRRSSSNQLSTTFSAPIRDWDSSAHANTNCCPLGIAS